MRSLATIIKTLELIAEEIDSEMQLSTLLTLLYVAQRGQSAQKSIEETLRLSSAAASRNVSYWSPVKADRKVGKGFIERAEDPCDRRHKILKLTPKGEQFIERVREHA